MSYARFQNEVYKNKLSRGFNTTDVGKEIILMTEEYGELCEALVEEDSEMIIDGLGDLMVYGLGMTSMFSWEVDKIFQTCTLAPSVECLEDTLPYIGRELGMLAKTYKKSNKRDVLTIDNRDEFRYHLGRLLGSCEAALQRIVRDPNDVIESIVDNNKTRTHQARM